MFNGILPDDMFVHPENQDRIYEALDEYFGTDVLIGDEKEKLMEVLENEPRILEFLKDELE